MYWSPIPPSARAEGGTGFWDHRQPSGGFSLGLADVTEQHLVLLSQVDERLLGQGDVAQAGLDLHLRRFAHFFVELGLCLFLDPLDVEHALLLFGPSLGRLTAGLL